MRRRSHILRRAMAVIIATFIACSLASAGERFTAAGNALGVEMNQELVRRGFCKDASECHHLIEVYGGHGDQVNFTAYGIGDGNRDALSTIVELIVRRGLHITGGVPITFQAHSKSHSESINAGLFRSSDIVLVLEVRK